MNEFAAMMSCTHEVHARNDDRLDSLPSELLLHILKFLPARSLARLNCTNRHLYEVITGEGLRLGQDIKARERERLYHAKVPLFRGNLLVQALRRYLDFMGGMPDRCQYASHAHALASWYIVDNELDIGETWNLADLIKDLLLQNAEWYGDCAPECTKATGVQSSMLRLLCSDTSQSALSTLYVEFGVPELQLTPSNRLSMLNDIAQRPLQTGGLTDKDKDHFARAFWRSTGVGDQEDDSTKQLQAERKRRVVERLGLGKALKGWMYVPSARATQLAQWWFKTYSFGLHTSAPIIERFSGPGRQLLEAAIWEEMRVMPCLSD